MHWYIFTYPLIQCFHVSFCVNPFGVYKPFDFKIEDAFAYDDFCRELKITCKRSSAIPGHPLSTKPIRKKEVVLVTV